MNMNTHWRELHTGGNYTLEGTTHWRELIFHCTLVDRRPGHTFLDKIIIKSRFYGHIPGKHGAIIVAAQ